MEQQANAEWLVPLLGAQSQLARGLVFSSLPLLLALSVAVWRPLM